MTTKERRVPLHLRDRAQAADQYSKKLAQVRDQRNNATLDPPPGPPVQIIGSRPTVQPGTRVAAEPLPPVATDPQPWPDPSVGQPLPVGTEPVQEPTGGALQDEPPIEPVAAPQAESEEIRNLKLAVSRAAASASAEAKRANNEKAEADNLRRQLAALKQTQENELMTRVDDAVLRQYFTEAELKEKGIEFCRNEVVRSRRIGAETARSMMAPQIEALSQQVQQQQQRADNAHKLALFAVLDNTKDIATWRTVDKDPQFVAWLASVEPLSGESYETLLFRGAKKPDIEQAAQSVAAVYRSYLSTLPKHQARPAPASRQLPVGRPAAAMPTNTRPDIITPARMKELNEEFRRTRDPKRRDEIQLELTRAQAEGRLGR